MKKLLIIFLFVSMVITGCSSDQGSESDGEKEKVTAEEVTYVKVKPVETMDFAHKLSLPGTLQPKEEVLVTAKVSGTAGNITIDIGSKVKKGDILTKIDDTAYRLQYEKTQKSLSIAQIKFENLEKDYFRKKALFENQVFSQSEMDNLETQYKIEKEALELAKNDYKLTKENLDYTNIRAPITGFITMKDVSTGENISPGKPIFGVINTDEMYVETGVSEKDIALISRGQKVHLRVESLDGKSFEGVITHIGPAPDPQSKTYPIKVLVKNQDSILKAGMFTTVEIIIESKNNVLSVLKEAVILENGKTYVFVEENGKAVRKEVELGFSNDTHHEIIEGIQEGEKVIVVGQNTLVDGSEIEVR